MKRIWVNFSPSKLLLILTVVAVASILAIFPVIAAAVSPLDVLCAHAKTGVVGAICELRDRVVALERKTPLLGPSGPQGKAGPKGERGPGLKVMQANGDMAGYLAGMSEDVNGPYRVWYPRLRKIISVDPYDGSLSFPETRSVFFYESDDGSVE